MINPRCLMVAACVATVSAEMMGAASAQGVTLPQRRAGLWEVVTTTQKPEKVPKISARMCIDAATDRELLDFGLRMSKDTCARYDVRGKGSTWTIDAECALGPVKMASRTQISGDFKSRVTMQIEGTMTGMPGASGAQATQIMQDLRWVSSDCPGMKPGDLMLDGGPKINVMDLRQLRKLLPNIQIR